MTDAALLASYFTFAGDTVPLRDMGPSPRGYSGPYGIEVLSDAVRHMPLDQLARTAFQTTARFVNA